MISSFRKVVFRAIYYQSLGNMHGHRQVNANKCYLSCCRMQDRGMNNDFPSSQVGEAQGCSKHHKSLLANIEGAGVGTSEQGVALSGLGLGDRVTCAPLLVVAVSGLYKATNYFGVEVGDSS
jgi:hypothetical protein